MLNEIFEEAQKITSEEMEILIEKTVNLLESERMLKEINGMLVNEDLVLCSPADIENCTIIGDIHGDLTTLYKILKHIDFEDRMKDKRNKIIFLGDYGDRGEKSPEVYYVILKLKLEYKNNIVLLRGNHEGPHDLMAYPHDLPLFLIEKFGSKGHEIYMHIKKLFEKFYLAFVVLGKFIVLHGGIPSKALTLEDIAKAKVMHPKKSLLEEILWNDPKEGEGIEDSYRGAGKLFGKDITEKFLKRNNLMLLIRGHEPAREGYYIIHDNMVITVFSRKGAPYFNEKAAFLDIKLSELKSKEDINKFIRVI
jgi:protein phosphatase